VILGFPDIILFITVFQLIIFTFFLFSKKPYKLSNLTLGSFLFAEVFGMVNCFVFYHFDFMLNNFPHIIFIGTPFCLVWGPLFYFYVRSVENSEFILRQKHFIHLIPATVVTLFLLIVFYFLSAETKRIFLKNPPGYFEVYTRALFYFVTIQIFAYNIVCLRILSRYRIKIKESFSSISKINLSWLSFVTIGYTTAHIISTFIQISRFPLGTYNEILNMIMFMTFAIFFNIIFFKGWQQPEIFSEIEEPVKYKFSKLTKEEAKGWIDKLNDLMTTQKPFLNPGLKLNQLAEEIDLSPRILSQIINEYFNQNFYDYINKLRIEESINLLNDSSNKMNVLEILYSVGFNSKPSFNTAFKKVTGLTPTEFKKNKSPERKLP